MEDDEISTLLKKNNTSKSPIKVSGANLFQIHTTKQQPAFIIGGSLL